jgi:predicted metal-dependent peptidase
MTMILPKPLDLNVLDRDLSKTKAKLFTYKGAGYLGSLMTNHKYVWDEDCSTAWCNSVTIGFNPTFYQNVLTPKSRVTVLAHEVWHTGCDHHGRVGDRNPEVWNYAGDHFINLMLEENGFSFENIEWALKDPRFRDMSTEQIYDILFREPPSGDPKNLDMRPIPKDTNKTDTLRKILKAQQSSIMAKEAGVIPGEVAVHVENYLRPQLPWEVLLAKFMTEVSQDDYSFKRPSRRYEDEYLPSKQGHNGLEHLCWYWDISGSMTDEQLNVINTEIKHVYDTYDPKRMTVVTFDTKIQDIFEFHEGDEFADLELHGRGGTSLTPVYEHIKDNQPTAAIVLSDLCCTPMQDNPGSQLLWVVIDNPKAKVNFGKMIHMTKEMIQGSNYDFTY